MFHLSWIAVHPPPLPSLSLFFFPYAPYSSDLITHPFPFPPHLFPVALMTISHRPSLFKYHTHLLKLGTSQSDTGVGEWEWSRIGTKEERLSLDREVEELDRRLAEVEKLKGRLAEINKSLQLGEDSGIHHGEIGGGGRLLSSTSTSSPSS